MHWSFFFNDEKKSILMRLGENHAVSSEQKFDIRNDSHKCVIRKDSQEDPKGS